MTGPHGAWAPRDPLAALRRAWLRTTFPPFRPQLLVGGNPPAVRVSLPPREAADASRGMSWNAPICFTCLAWQPLGEPRADGR
jgi:hypothetical protein